MDELVGNSDEKADQPLQELNTQVSQQGATKNCNQSEIDKDPQLESNSGPLEFEEENEATQTPSPDEEEERCCVSSEPEQSLCLQVQLEQVRTERSRPHRQVQRLCVAGSQQGHHTDTDSTGPLGSQADRLPRRSEQETDSYTMDNRRSRSTQRVRRLSSPIRVPPTGRSPTRQAPVKGGTYDSELIRALQERDDLQSMLDKYERHLSEMQANIRVLTTDRDKTRAHYQQAQEEIATLRREVVRSRGYRGSKGSVTAQSVLKRLEDERDEARSNLHRMSTERDSLRERLKISQETAISERAHLEQRLEDLQNAVLTLEQERGEEKSRQAQLREAVAGLEEEVRALRRQLAASEDDLGRLRNQCNALRLCHGRAESSLGDAQHRLASRTAELQSAQERSMRLDERNESLLKELVGLREELNVVQGALSELEQSRDTVQDELERRSCQLSSTHRQLEDKENTIRALKLQVNDLETTTDAVRVMVSSREWELDAARKKVSDLGDELASALKVQDTTLLESAQLRGDLDQARLDLQALQLKLDEAVQEKAGLERKVQKCTSDVSRVEDLLSSKERECHELQECQRRASEQASDWEEQAREAEASAAELRLGLHSSDSEKRALRVRVESLEGSLQEALSAKQSQSAELAQLNHRLQKQEAELHEVEAELKRVEAELRRVEAERSHAQRDLAKTRELCVKLDASKEAARREQEVWRSEAELLREQLTSERVASRGLQSLLASAREKDLHRQLSSQEKLAELQLLRDKLAVADSKASTQGREMVQLRSRSAQLEADLEATRKQLTTERLERECAVQDLHRLGLSSSPALPAALLHAALPPVPPPVTPSAPTCPGRPNSPASPRTPTHRPTAHSTGV
ncbi:testis-specific gene 10 protein isoform X2 [Brachyhypopomus gauderio]|uniref:testis-specific gene 10 protein isoform X2 n=1 Tax=Brachyhypopomus gauderio TaxID=698409 RepID=UPI004041774E